MTDYNARYRARAAILKERTESPEGKATWKRFNNAVARCRVLEAKYGLLLWGHGLARGDMPIEYIQAVEEWETAQAERDKLYEIGPGVA